MAKRILCVFLASVLMFSTMDFTVFAQTDQGQGTVLQTQENEAAASVSPSASAEKTEEPIVNPTEESTEEPTVEPLVSPTIEPVIEPTETPIPSSEPEKTETPEGTECPEALESATPSTDVEKTTEPSVEETTAPTEDVETGMPSMTPSVTPATDVMMSTKQVGDVGTVRKEGYDLTYKYEEDGICITGVTCWVKDINVEIPSSIDGTTVVSLGDSAFSNSRVSEVSIPSSVVTMGSNVFANSKVNTVTIKASISELEYGMFYHCTELENVYLPDSLTIIGINCFFECDALTNIDFLPESVVEIGMSAFWGCDNLQTAVLPAKLGKIDWGAFEKCPCLTSVVANAELTEVGIESFKDCINLTQFTYDLTQEIFFDKNCFENTGFETFAIGDNVFLYKTSNVFRGCKNLINFEVSANNKVLYAIDGVLYARSSYHSEYYLVAYPMGRQDTYYKCAEGAHISAYAFWGADSLEQIELVPNTQYFYSHTILLGAFYGCSNLQEIINLDKYALCDGLRDRYKTDAIFGDCTSLRELSVFSTNIDMADFYGCTKLKRVRIYAGISVMGELRACPSIEEVEFESSSMRVSVAPQASVIHPFVNYPDVIIVCHEGSKAEKWAIDYNYQYRYFGSNIIHNKRQAPNESSTWKVSKDCAGIVVTDKKSKKYVSNAAIDISGTQYITDSQGRVSFVASNEETRKNITVSADGYELVNVTKSIKNGKIAYIELLPISEDIGIIAAEVKFVDAESNETVYDLLGDKLVLGYMEKMDELTDREEQTMEIAVYSNREEATYQIVEEDGTILLSNDTGKFEEKVITEGKNSDGSVISTSMPIVDSFEPGKKYYVKVMDSEGNSILEKIGLSTTANYVTKENIHEKSSFELGESLKIKVPEDVPLIGGGTYEIGFEDALPIEIAIEDNDNGKVKIAINKPATIPFNEYEEKYKQLEKKAKSSIEVSKAFGPVQKFGAGFFGVDGKLSGYGEGTLSEINQGKIVIKVGFIAEIEGKGGYKQYFMTPVFIPVNVFVEGKATGSAELNAEVTVENWKVADWDISGGEFNVKIELTGGGGIGCGLEVNASVTGSANYIWKPARSYQKVWLEASGKITAVAFVFEKDLWKSSNYKYTLYEEGKDTKPYSINGEMTTGQNEFQAVSRSYLDYSQGYNAATGSQRSAADKSVKSIVREAVFPAANPQMVEVNGIKYLFWLEDIISRNANNRTAIVYSESKDGVSWNAPVRLLQEEADGTLDGDFSLAVQENYIYVTWQDAVREITEQDDVIRVAENIVIRRVALDTRTEQVVEDKILTAEPGYYLYPDTCITDGDIYSVYALSDLKSGDVSGDNGYTLYYTKNDGTPVKRNLPAGSQIVNMTIGNFDSEAYAICELDMDGTVETDDDREIYAIALENDSSIQLSSNDVCDTMPVIADSGNIYWYQLGNIVRMEGVGGNIRTIWEEGQISSEVVLASVTEDGGKDSLVWEAADSEASDGAIAIYKTYEGADGTWSNATRCIETDGTITSQISVINNNGKIMAAYLEGVFLEDGGMLKDLCVSQETEKADISLDYINFEEEASIPGNVLPLEIGITNHGNTTVEAVRVNVNNGSEQLISGINLQPNSSTVVSVDSFTVPMNLTGETNCSVQILTDGETNLQDNEDKFLLGCPDFYVEAGTRMESGNTWIDFSVWNNAAYSGSGTVKIHKDGEDGEVILEKTFEGLSKDNGYAWTAGLGDHEATSTAYYVEVVADGSENIVGNNVEFVYIGYGTGIERVEAEKEETEISAISLSENACAMTVGDIIALSVTADSGETLDNSKILFSSVDKTVANVDENGVITAYRAGKTQITAYCGEVSAVCEVAVSDNLSKSLVVQFDSQGGTRIESITGIIPGSTITIPVQLEKENCIFDGWYTLPEGGEKVYGSTLVVKSSMTLYAHWLSETDVPGDLWIQEIPDQTYTGKALIPVVYVYNGMTLLEEKKDYTVSYKNNTKANDAFIEKTAPTITVTGKGNYSGKETVTFKILQKDISDADIVSDDLVLKYSGKVQKSIPVLTYNGKKLRNNTDFTVEYPDAVENTGAYKESGTYQILIKGKGNYTGERTVTLTITENILMSKVTVSKIANQPYTGSPVKPSMVVKSGKLLLTEGTDYTVKYENNKEIGTATVTLTGKGNYSGEKKVTFKIIGGALNKAKVTGIPRSLVYTGEELTLNSPSWGEKPVLTMTVNKEVKTLTEGTDYTVSYQKNTDKGTGTILFTGINGYTGTLKKTFRITAYDIGGDTEEKMSAVLEGQPVYAKGGSKPEPVVTFDGTELVPGKDYTLSYKNNTAVNDGSNAKKIPTVTIKGKGNYSGSMVLTYTIAQQDISSLSVSAADKVYKNKRDAYRSVPKITDLDGKTLGAGKDYEKTFIYSYGERTVLADGTVREENQLIGLDDILPAGTLVEVTVTGKGNYTGILKGQYRIVAADIAGARITIPDQTYTGKEITPDESQITAILKKETLQSGVDYEIVEGSYKDNVKKGTASVTVRGIGNYGGTKAVKFKIKAKGFLWWWRH